MFLEKNKIVWCGKIPNDLQGSSFGNSTLWFMYFESISNCKSYLKEPNYINIYINMVYILDSINIIYFYFCINELYFLNIYFH